MSWWEITANGKTVYIDDSKGSIPKQLKEHFAGAEVSVSSSRKMSEHEMTSVPVKQQAGTAATSTYTPSTQQTSYTPPSAQQAEQDIVKATADLVEQWQNQQNQALSDIGIFSFDADKAREDALAILEPYFSRELADLKANIGEKRIQSQEDYDARMAEITGQASEQLKSLDIQSAQTEEELQQKLSDIGASTQYNLAQARQAWDERLRQQEQSDLGAGRGFSGVMQETTQRLGSARGLEMTELARRGGVQTQAEETTAKYTREKVAAAREAVEAYKQRGTAEAETAQARSARLYGTGEDYGLTGSQQMGELERRKHEAELAQINQLRQEQYQTYSLARESALAGANTVGGGSTSFDIGMLTPEERESYQRLGTPLENLPTYRKYKGL